MIQREKRRVKCINKYFTKRQTIQVKLKTADSFQKRVEFYKEFEKLPKDSAPSRNRNRCWVSGRSRGFYNDFGLSRHVLREMAHEGYIPGLQKASW